MAAVLTQGRGTEKNKVSEEEGVIGRGEGTHRRYT